MKTLRAIPLAVAIALSTNANAASITFDASINYATANASITSYSGTISSTDSRSRSTTISKFDSSLGELTGAYLTYSFDTQFFYDSRINGDWSLTQLYQQGSTVTAQHSLNYSLSLDSLELESGSYSSSSGGTSYVEEGVSYLWSSWSRSTYPVPAWRETKPANWLSSSRQFNGAINLLDYFTASDLLSSDPSDILTLQIDQNAYLAVSCNLYSNSSDCWASTQGQGDITSSITYSYNEISAVPVPAAAWLFGSGLAGLVGFAGRKKA